MILVARHRAFSRCERHSLLHSPYKVIAKQSQTNYFFKSFGAELKGIIAGLESFAAIHDATNSGLLGPDACMVSCHGILGTLQYAAYEERNRWHLHRWATDLNDVLESLHQAGLMWGDAKPENVFVDDDDDNVGVIDFGGGCTPGWVSQDNKCTKRGDLEATEKMQDWLVQLGN
ncbi:hypothetical protein FPRO03_13903 [Fusarium proliferatum]|nr:hypothetical protein FPRO03_13903 [Fusarium proliferatum]